MVNDSTNKHAHTHKPTRMPARTHTRTLLASIIRGENHRKTPNGAPWRQDAARPRSIMASLPTICSRLFHFQKVNQQGSHGAAAAKQLLCLFHFITHICHPLLQTLSRRLSCKHQGAEEPHIGTEFLVCCRSGRGGRGEEAGQAALHSSVQTRDPRRLLP